MMPLVVAALVAQCAPNVSPVTMSAILRVESGFRPHAIGYLVRGPAGKVRLARQPRDTVEAISWAKWLLANGYRFDAGPAQVNSSNFERYGLDAVSAFDPCSNVRAAGDILTDEYLRAARKFQPGQVALRHAISSYNTGNFADGFANGYVQRVTDAAAAADAGAAPLFQAP